MYQSNFSAPLQPLAPFIAELINEANALIKEVSPNGDYCIDAESGTILGKRQKPSLTGELVYDHSAIGWVGIGMTGAAVAGEYFKGEPFASHIDNVVNLSLFKLEERIANLQDPSQPVTLYEGITVACTAQDLFVDALVVALEERGFVVDTQVGYNHWNLQRSRASGWNQPAPNPTTFRLNRKQFIARWVPLLKGTDFVNPEHSWAPLMPGVQYQDSQLQTLTSTDSQPE